MKRETFAAQSSTLRNVFFQFNELIACVDGLIEGERGCAVYRVINAVIKPWLSHTLSICSPPLLADAIRNLIMHYPKFRSNETKKKKNGFEVQLWSIIRPRGKFNRSNSRARVHIYIVYRVFPLPRNPRIRGWIARARARSFTRTRKRILFISMKCFRWKLYRDTLESVPTCSKNFASFISVFPDTCASLSFRLCREWGTFVWLL